MLVQPTHNLSGIVVSLLVKMQINLKYFHCIKDHCNQQLVEQADGRIIIMPGSGVRSNNIKELAEYTGAVELHSSARKNIASAMEFVNENMQENLQNISVDVDEIRRMKEALSV